MSQPTMDADLASTLTPEELEAINAEAGPEESQIMRQGNPGDGDDDPDDEGDGQPVEGKPAAAPTPAPAPAVDDPSAPAPAPAPAPAGDPAAGEGDAPQAAAPEPETAAPTPRYEAKLPDDYKDRVDALATAEGTAWEKFDAGDLDRTQLQAELARVANERNDLNALRVKAEISTEMNEQTAAQTWQNTVSRFIATEAKAEGGIDYRKDEAMAADLDDFVKKLANNPQNNDKSMDWFLVEAHKRVRALHGLVAAPAPAPAPTPQTPAQKVAAAVANRKAPEASSMPASLAQVPGGDGPGDVASEFAEVLALEGQAYEDAIARMTPAQREKFLQG